MGIDIMNENNIYWMDYSIEILKNIQSGLRTSTILVSENNKLIYSVACIKKHGKSCVDSILNKIKNLKLFKIGGIYMTINTFSNEQYFDLAKLLEVIHANEVYIGLPDPELSTYLSNDPVLKSDNIYRYPDELQRKILEINNLIFSSSKQCIKYNLYYSKKRIGKLIIDNLKLGGYEISKEELNINKDKNSLVNLLQKKYRIEYLKALHLVEESIAKAFDIKYATYNYIEDVRSIDLEWKKDFVLFYKKSKTEPVFTNKIINVGIGGGIEAATLFSDCLNITFVDIAQDSLRKIKINFPHSNIINSSADNLTTIPDDSFDMYVSLRTYNSSFFNIRKAVCEAYRVLKPNGLIIISIANGFLSNEYHNIIPGLIIPGTEFVDIYRGLDVVKLIRTELIGSGFKNIQIQRTDTEIYISAIAKLL